MLDDYKPERGFEHAGELAAFEADSGEMLDLQEMIEPLDADSLNERTPESQYCVFRAGRERFCLSVLMIDQKN